MNVEFQEILFEVLNRMEFRDFVEPDLQLEYLLDRHKLGLYLEGQL